MKITKLDLQRILSEMERHGVSEADVLVDISSDSFGFGSYIDIEIELNTMYNGKESILCLTGTI